MFQGVARSGKGSIRDIAKELAGGCANPQLRDLNDKHGLVCAIDKKLIVINECEDMSRSQVAVLKAATGNDAITIHVKYSDSFDGVLDANWLLISNQMVSFPDPSGAIMTRLLPLKFENGCSDKKIDTTLKRELLKELPGIARLAREAYLRYRQNGFTNNPHVDDLLESTREDSSPITTFIRDCCKVGEGLTVTRQKLYSAYQRFLAELGHDPVTARTFASQLKAACNGISNGSRQNQERTWLGINLKGN